MGLKLNSPPGPTQIRDYLKPHWVKICFMPDVFLRMAPDGKDWEIKWWEETPGKEPHYHPRLATSHFQMKSCRAGWEICPSSEFLLLSPEALSQGSPWRLPVRTVTLCFSHNNDTRVQWVWNYPCSDFSQCVNREDSSGERNNLPFLFSGLSLTHCKEHDQSSCEDAEHQAPNQLADQKG